MAEQHWRVLPPAFGLLAESHELHRDRARPAGDVAQADIAATSVIHSTASDVRSEAQGVRGEAAEGRQGRLAAQTDNGTGRKGNSGNTEEGMRTNLYWEPARVMTSKSLPCALKFILREKYGCPVNVMVTETNKPYFQGLASAKVDGAQEVLDLYENHGEIHLRER